ncbi:hypothetical protein [Paeniglutamicibacter cryotolerans]|uniref:Uncharacterized protein n=1 Tax=Paeniglutamicibacter cryotolerans TaxID=670079 RepID=A0A839QQE7_9MICC|nr:hypothetical protein [Paeniglutamicibacter cryotolerans]MBB2996216.1 hypothetical protein [Paeniglutamicibacter cryotolerans]
MSKKNTSKSKNRSKSAKDARATGSSARSIGLAQMRALEPRFIRWASEDSASAEASQEFSGIGDVLAAYSEEFSFGSIDALDPDAVFELLESITEHNRTILAEVSFLLDRYLHFLDDSGLWGSGDENFEAIHSMLANPMSDPGFDVPELDEEEIGAQARELPIVRRAIGMIRWIGTGIDVSEAGDLSPAQLLEAAAALGDEAPDPDGILPLSTLWESLEETELISVEGTRATPTAKGLAILGEDATEFAQVCFDLLIDQLTMLVYGTADEELEETIGDTMLGFLTAAAGEEPPPATALEMDWDDEAMRQESEAVEELRAALPYLKAARDAGILAMAGEDLIVPPVVRSPLAAFIEVNVGDDE